MQDKERLLFEMFRGIRLLLRHFGLEDDTLFLPGEFVCTVPDGYPVIYFEGPYADCLYHQLLHPEQIVLSALEHQLRAEHYKITHGQLYDEEYCQMIRENRIVDKELQRRHKVRRKRRGRPVTK